MILEVHTPAPPLDRFVRRFVYFEGFRQAHDAERLLPDGGIDMIFDLTEERRKLFDNDDATRFVTLRRSWISGLRTGFITIDAGASSMFNVHFRADGAHPILGMPLAGLRDRVVELDAVLGAEAHRFREALLEAPGPAAKFRIAEERLLRLARRGAPADPVVRSAVDAIDADPGGSRMAEVSRRTGYTHKHFCHLFERATGLTPKRYARIRKFQRAIEAIGAARRVDWAQLALACGYFDQSHFIHDFARFSGVTPSEYLDARGEHLNYLPVS